MDSLRLRIAPRVENDVEIRARARPLTGANANPPRFKRRDVAKMPA